MTSVTSPSKLFKHMARPQESEANGSFTEQELSDYAASLNNSLQNLQNQVQQHEALLQKLRKDTGKSPLDRQAVDRRERLHQVNRVTTAYQKFVTAEPVLPSAKSPLPALLAVRNAVNLIDQSKAAVETTSTTLAQARSRLRHANQMHKDAQQLTESLDSRLKTLETEAGYQDEVQTSGIASALIKDQQQRRQQYARDMRGLVKALNRFVNDYLGVMLAAEDLGGPTVGEVTDISEDNLKAGFTAQGKAKKPAAESDLVERRRAQRNADVWGVDSASEDAGLQRSEKEAAAVTFRNLAESLLNAATEADRDDSYVSIVREDAAVRLLVRASVAQFDPHDARRLRLFDFGTGTR